MQGDGDPELRRGGILWTGGLLMSPIEVVYTVRVPLWEMGINSVKADMAYQLSGMINAVTESPTPSTLSLAPRDSDGDGLPDGLEAHYSGGPTNMLPDGDDDGDGLTNLHSTAERNAAVSAPPPLRGCPKRRLHRRTPYPRFHGFGVR